METGKMVDIGTWNYRVVRKNGLLGIHEAYYDDCGNVRSLSMEPVSPTYEDVAQLKTNLTLMIDALEETVLDFDQIS